MSEKDISSPKYRRYGLHVPSLWFRQLPPDPPSCEVATTRMTETTAILLFSRTATAEASLKPFGRGGVEVARALISRTERTLRRTGLPVFRSDERSQRGTTFGERLANAMAEVYATGVERLIVVGNDCPYLTPLHLRAAARMLASGRNVFGPDRRGGSWLIGLQRRDFEMSTFAALAWNTPALADEFRRCFTTASELTVLADLNRISEIREAWSWLKSLLSCLHALLFGRFNAIITEGVTPLNAVSLFSDGRAPPVA